MNWHVLSCAECSRAGESEPCRHRRVNQVTPGSTFPPLSHLFFSEYVCFYFFHFHFFFCLVSHWTGFRPGPRSVQHMSILTSACLHTIAHIVHTCRRSSHDGAQITVTGQWYWSSRTAASILIATCFYFHSNSLPWLCCVKTNMHICDVWNCSAHVSTCCSKRGHFVPVPINNRFANLVSHLKLLSEGVLKRVCFEDVPPC